MDLADALLVLIVVWTFTLLSAWIGIVAWLRHREMRLRETQIAQMSRMRLTAPIGADELPDSDEAWLEELAIAKRQHDRAQAARRAGAA